MMSVVEDEETDVMRMSRFNEQQIIAILKEFEAGPPAFNHLCERFCTSSAADAVRLEVEVRRP
jgi:hypothetical protein